ncbi:MAG: response regulator, partial [Acidobacteriota bacterium]
EEEAPPATVLVIDDEPVIQQVLANHLRVAGYRPLIASSGLEGIRILEEEPVDLVLLDLMMPGLSGYETCRRIRERYSLEQLPILILSARGRPEDRSAGLEEGANDYLSKPIAKEELLSRLSTHLQLLDAHRRQSSEVQALRRLLPICASCKRIRDENGEWTHLENYLYEHMETTVSHGLCPSCLPDYLEGEAGGRPRSG